MISNCSNGIGNGGPMQWRDFDSFFSTLCGYSVLVGACMSNIGIQAIVIVMTLMVATVAIEEDDADPLGGIWAPATVPLSSSFSSKSEGGIRHCTMTTGFFKGFGGRPCDANDGMY